MQKKIFPMLALLCAVAQGAKAQNGWSVWDGSEKSKPQHYDSYAGISDVYVINNAAELKYVQDNFGDFYEKNLYLGNNIDMTAKSWEPLVYEDKSGGYYYAFEGTFYGNDHTIRIKGGLVGYNNGDVKHCTFYGEVDCNHDNEDSKYIGDQSENADKLYDSFNQDEYNDASSDAQVRFIGTYDAETFDATDNSILLMGSSNTLYYPLKDATIGACRAYFKIGEDGSAGDHARITAFNLNFGDDGSTIDPAGIHAIDAGESAPQGWYDMQGRKLIGKPSRAGVYI